MSNSTTNMPNSLAVRELTESVYNCLILDVWPSPAGIKDFGLESTEHYGALQNAVKHDGVTVEQLDDACGCGSALTALIAAGNPYHGVTFTTVWDTLLVPIKSWAVVTENKFPLGRLFATPELLGLATRAEVNAALGRHAAGDRGEGVAADYEETPGESSEILSRYRLTSGGEFYVRTSFNPPMTIALTESELEF